MKRIPFKKIFATVILLNPSLLIAKQITYHEDIAPILNRNCIGCHQNGGVAPFPLTNYREVKPFAAAVLEACRNHTMPHGATARPECSPPGTFLGPSRISYEQIKILESWVDQGATEGVQGKQLKTAMLNQDEDLGEPDIVIPLSPEGFALPASGDGINIIRNFPISVPFKVDQFVTAVKIIQDGGDENSRNGLSQIIHHAHLFYDEKAISTKLLADFHRDHPDDKQPGFEGDQGLPKVVLGPWFPGGNGITRYKEGVGARIKAGSNIVLQVHYALHNKKAFVDRTSVGLWFARKPVKAERKTVIVKNESFTIPAGQEGTVTASKTLEKDIVLYSMLPHMHQFGKNFIVTALHPDGKRECLVDVDWDFNHQNQFVYVKPKLLKAGTTLELNALYDNTATNPNQMNSPPIDIPWGESSFREMMLTMFAFSEAGGVVTTKTPKIDKAFVDPITKEIVVRGRSIQQGAFLELGNKLIIDPQIRFKKNSSVLAEVRTRKWKKVLGKTIGGKIKVTVINPAGGRSNGIEMHLKN